MKKKRKEEITMVREEGLSELKNRTRTGTIGNDTVVRDLSFGGDDDDYENWWWRRIKKNNLSYFQKESSKRLHTIITDSDSD